jgi:hypothetical protein
MGPADSLDALMLADEEGFVKKRIKPCYMSA